MPKSQRIAYIDFMKSLCIMLIVMYHIDHEFFNYLAPNLNNALQVFRLPMYYFISGIFFKTYDGLTDFTRRKVNNILVPFVFFVVLAFVARIAEAIIRWAIGADPIDVYLGSLFEPFYLRYWSVTTPLWFLLSLFWVNLIYYALRQWIKPWWGVLTAVVLVSLIGYWLGRKGIQLPWMLDTSLVALPYFILGWAVKRLSLERPSSWDMWGVLILVIAAIPIYYMSEFMNLHFMVLPPYWKLYLLPIIAILALFWTCKRLPYIPVVCYYGRYSLIILGTHPLLFLPLRSFFILKAGMMPGISLTLLVFVLTMALEWPVIWMLKTYAPRFTAQKPLILKGWKLH